MEISRLILKNTARHSVRSIMTAVGIGLALFAFCMIRTMVDSWYTGVKASAKNRLITRNSVSLVFYLPVAYKTAIASVPGVTKVGAGNWFGGVYKDEKFRFAQFAVDDNYLDIYPEYVLSAAERQNYADDRKGALVGADLAEKFGFKVGDVIQLKGTIFPGLWEFDIAGIYKGRDENTITRTLFFHWEYLNERNKKEIFRNPDNVGFYAIQIANGANPASVASAIDAKFANSFAETLTETETAFQQSFVSMSSTIILALNTVCFIVVIIMLLVLTNTMLMSARERYREYAILKSIGFGSRHIAMLIFGEALVISLTGFTILCLLLIPVFSVPPAKLLGDLINFFPVFRLNSLVLGMCFLTTLFVGFWAGFLPFRTIMKLKVSETMRQIN